MSKTWDAIVVGSGPNGLAAAIELADRGFGVLVLEGAETIGGGMRTSEATLPGFFHDECSAIQPLALLSPFFRKQPLEEHGLEWLTFSASVAHPLDDGPAPLLTRSLVETGERLGEDARRWWRLVGPFLSESKAGDDTRGREQQGDPRNRATEPLADRLEAPGRLPDRTADLFADLLEAPGRLPRLPLLSSRRPLQLARFGLRGLRSATALANAKLKAAPARALLAGCAAHSVLPLEKPGTAAFGLLFALAAHAVDWPCARGGSGAIAAALASRLRQLGGSIETRRPVRSLRDLPAARVVLFDLAPEPFAALADGELPPGYLARLRRFRYGPGAFKLDWALDGPIPWRDAAVGGASTVHVGGTLEEIAASERDAWEGRVAERPFLIVCQQSAADPGRAPEGKQTGYAYCHVPNGCDVDMTERIERQIERFAPGFRDRILARRALAPADFQRLNPNLVGGAITGGAATLRQLVARPMLRWSPYATPDPRLFLCSASTPPGGGVHGMCGVHAARAAMARLGAA
jgi:phytoene dehydrogenase-like protein